MSKYVFYVNVGALPPSKAKERMEEIKKEMTDTGFFGDDRVLFVAVRDEPTRVELLPEHGVS